MDWRETPVASYYSLSYPTNRETCVVILLINQFVVPMSTDEQKRVSRRRFLQSLGFAGLVGTSGSLLVACGGGSDDSSQAASCSDLSQLSQQEMKQRKQMVKSLKYVEESPKPDRTCSNCNLFVKKEYGDDCGGCTLFPGPVHPQGYCNSWAPTNP